MVPPGMRWPQSVIPWGGDDALEKEARGGVTAERFFDYCAEEREFADIVPPDEIVIVVVVVGVVVVSSRPTVSRVCRSSSISLAEIGRIAQEIVEDGS